MLMHIDFTCLYVLNVFERSGRRKVNIFQAFNVIDFSDIIQMEQSFYAAVSLFASFVKKLLLELMQIQGRNIDSNICFHEKWQMQE